MTVPANLNRVDYTGTGSAGPFTVPFPFYDTSHLTVLQTDALFNQTTLTGWTATGAGGPSGAVTLAAACPVGSTLTIMRVVPLTQITSIKNQEAFYPEVHEQEMDLLAMADQQLDEAMDRTLRLPAGLSGVDMTLPRPDPGHALVWNAAGDGLENAGSASATLQQDLADSADVAKGDEMIAVKQPFAGAVARTQHDKNAEWVSVLDFGAVGDGVADDTSAFESAIATNKRVYVPSSIYKITRTLTISGGQPGVFGDGPYVSVLTKYVDGELIIIPANGSTIQDIGIEGQGHTYTGGGIYPKGYNIHIRHCRINGTQDCPIIVNGAVGTNADSATYLKVDSCFLLAYNTLDVYAARSLSPDDSGRPTCRVFSNISGGGNLVNFSGMNYAVLENSLGQMIEFNQYSGKIIVKGCRFTNIANSIIIYGNDHIFLGNAFGHGTGFGLSIDASATNVNFDASNSISIGTNSKGSIEDGVVDGAYQPHNLATNLLPYTFGWIGSISNPDPGTSAKSAYYRLNGRMCYATFAIILNSSATVGSGVYSFKLPFKSFVDSVGTFLYKKPDGTYYVGAISVSGGSNVGYVYFSSIIGAFSSTTFTIGTNSTISCSIDYLVAGS